MLYLYTREQVARAESPVTIFPVTCHLVFGRVAQLGERGVRNAEVEGSNPFASTICLLWATFKFTSKGIL